jgi:hypothetical protein
MGTRLGSPLPSSFSSCLSPFLVLRYPTLVLIVRLCNNPFGTEWTIIELRCTNPYHPEILLEEVQSWLKKLCNLEVKKEELRYWHIWDEDGQVQLGDQRSPRDGE